VFAYVRACSDPIDARRLAHGDAETRYPPPRGLTSTREWKPRTAGRKTRNFHLPSPRPLSAPAEKNSREISVAIETARRICCRESVPERRLFPIVRPDESESNYSFLMKRMHINGECLASYASEIGSGRETSLEAECITPLANAICSTPPSRVSPRRPDLNCRLT